MNQRAKEYIFHHLKWTLQRINLTYDLYLAIYKTTLSSYEENFGISELRFIEVELTSLKDFLHYKQYIDQTLPVSRDEKIDRFESTYKPLYPLYQETMKQLQMKDIILVI